MKKLILTFTGIIFTSISYATSIEATVIFENLTNKEFITGEFTIIELNKTTLINNTESFKITLPEKGKYQFSFATDNYTAYTIYPTRINNRKNTITIRLTEKTNLKSSRICTFPLILHTDKNDKKAEKQLSEGILNFIMHGIDSSIPNEYIEFKEKYGIGLIKVNCIMDPISYKKATENNQMISDYLNQKYGTKWINELKVKPIGIK